MLTESMRPSQWFALSRYTPGRRAWMVAQIRASADMLGFGPVVARCDEHLTLERRVWSELVRWAAAATHSDGATIARLLQATDQERERGLDALVCALELQSMQADRAEGEAARQILARALPDGADGITRLSCRDETLQLVALVSRLRGELREPARAAHLGAWLALIDEANASFAHQYEDLPLARRVAWDALRAADANAHERFLELLSYLLDVARGDDQADLRDELLAPVRTQQREIRELVRRFHAVPDVDPERGTPLREPRPQVAA
ncbi:MAG: DUF6261 family protein [Myxococcota bacterium]